MNYASAKEELKSLTENIKDISKNYYLIKKNDSILKLTKMSNDERIAFLTNILKASKAKEAKEERNVKSRKRKQNRVETVDFSFARKYRQQQFFLDFNGTKASILPIKPIFLKAKKNLSKFWK